MSPADLPFPFTGYRDLTTLAERAEELLQSFLAESREVLDAIDAAEWWTTGCGWEPIRRAGAALRAAGFGDYLRHMTVAHRAERARLEKEIREGKVVETDPDSEAARGAMYALLAADADSEFTTAAMGCHLLAGVADQLPGVVPGVFRSLRYEVTEDGDRQCASQFVDELRANEWTPAEVIQRVSLKNLSGHQLAATGFATVLLWIDIAGDIPPEPPPQTRAETDNGVVQVGGPEAEPRVGGIIKVAARPGAIPAAQSPPNASASNGCPAGDLVSPLVLESITFVSRTSIRHGDGAPVEGPRSAVSFLRAFLEELSGRQDAEILVGRVMKAAGAGSDSSHNYRFSEARKMLKAAGSPMTICQITDEADELIYLKWSPARRHNSGSQQR